MLSGEVMECLSHVAVFGQFGRDLAVFHAVCRDEVVECSLSVDMGFTLTMRQDCLHAAPRTRVPGASATIQP